MVIVGAGVTGLVSAVRCALAGHQVTVLERGAVPDPGSTSFDQHRALRTVNPTDPEATRRLAETHHRWLELEHLLCGSAPRAGFYRRVGVLTGWPAAKAAAAVAVGADAGLPVEVVAPDAYPHLRFPEGGAVLREPHAGVLLADRVLWAAAGWLRRHPAVRLRPWCPVSSVDADSGRVTLADDTVEEGDLVLVACGPWSSALVDTPTVTYRQTMVYLRAPDEVARWWDTAPSAGRIGTRGDAWMLPSGDGTLVKVSSSTACRQVSGVDDEDDEDEHVWSARILAAQPLTDMDRYTVVAVKRCHYAVDTHTAGAHLAQVGPAVWARAASGGDGFRTAPFVADHIVGALSRSQPPLTTTGRNPR
ncbi:FAD-dependent oxidoreductase [Nocardiopsis sp. MG754419]|nr:FAD-dependent oxidoreductase [Nocardiopsis sp. MG754419]